MSKPVKNVERRLVYRMMIRWREARGAVEIPSLEEMSLQNMERIWPDVFILSKLDDEGGPVFERVGESFSGDGGAALVGRPVLDAPEDTLIGQALADLGKVLEMKVPFTHDGKFVNKAGQTVLFRSIIMPISETPGVIDRLMCAANSKVK
ncbi:MAG: hypothetical protein A3G18_13415 [Rhodospirillales bacterium RIFCSPLOWO2_12_FULL_58_28]|nr:MAG: hypothetical protein A3H92_13270 [Rhodospirillales bacterium RIFCSPLOWO2_02_FULL_58_16]OHC78572.1 MAG: hypothetical protein A3G18_13415 [Rhodospirillales bacterium RIFCSPLOWO2_12_FULL_58_28]